MVIFFIIIHFYLHMFFIFFFIIEGASRYSTENKARKPRNLVGRYKTNATDHKGIYHFDINHCNWNNDVIICIRIISFC